MSSTRLVSFLVVILALTGSILHSSAQGVSYQTGLRPGDTALFTVTGPLSENVTRTEMVVLSVDGPRLRANFTDSYKDGTQGIPDTFYLDLATGERNSTEPGASFIFAVATNLSPSDPLYTGSPNTITRRETVECGGQRRDTVFGTYTNPVQISIQSYWDRSSGILCLFTLDDPGTSGPEDVRLSMMSTGLWTAQSLFLSDLLFIAPFVLLAAALITVLLFVRSRSRSRKNVPRS